MPTGCGPPETVIVTGARSTVVDVSPETPDTAITIDIVDIADQEYGLLVVNAFSQWEVLGLLAGSVLQLLPDPATWRLWLTGDLRATVDRVDPQPEAYTLERGAGRAGARTSRGADGVYDIVIDVASFLTLDTQDPEEMGSHARAAAAHLGLHEAGHAELDRRGENDSCYQEQMQGSNTERGWRRVLACHLDDFRIERMTRDRAPAPNSQIPGLAGALEHLSAELTASKAAWTVDIAAANVRSIEALSATIRVIAYTTAELGLTEDGRHGVPPADPPAGWARYLESSWDAWALVFHEARAADREMTSDELAAVLARLCRLTVRWSDSIGFQWRLSEDLRESAYWTSASY